MTKITRIFLNLVLSLSLVLTGQSMAMARGMSPAADQIVICTGSGPMVMTVDAEGNPTAPSHLCPDCALNLLQGVLTQGMSFVGFTGWHKIQAHDTAIVLVRLGLVKPRVRDPPLVL